MKSKKIWPVLGVIGLGTSLAALIWFSPGVGTPKPIQAVKPEEPAAVFIPPPNPEAEETSESTLNPPPTRPATAAEIEECEKKGKLPADWPVERTWKIAHSEKDQQDICLATHNIRLKNNKISTIEDSMVSDEYSAIDRSSIHSYFKKEGYFAVGNSFMENTSMTLVSDKNGESFDILCGEPVFSPQGQWVVGFCTTSYGESASNQIIILAVSESGLKQVYDSGETAESPEIVKWLDNNTLSIEKLGDDVDGKEHNVILSQLQYRNGSWKLDPPMAPARQSSVENKE